MKYKLKVDGMACSMCEAHVNDCIRNNFKVKKVKSNHKSGEVLIESVEPLDKTLLKDIIDKTGYIVLKIEEA